MTPDQITREIQWEMDGVERGVNRYRKHIAESPLPDTDPGQTMLTEILVPLVPAIRSAQEEALAGIQKNGRGRIPEWWWPMLCLSAEKLAVITTRTLLGGANAGTYDAVLTATSLAGAIATRVKQEREYELWRDKQATKEKAAKERGERPTNLYKLMLSRVKQVDQRTAAKWMRLSKDVDRLEWSAPLKVHLGMKLLALTIEHGGGWFEAVLVPSRRGRRRITTRQVRLTELAKTWLAHHHARCELTRPWLLPMICPPQPWRKVE